MKVHTILYVFDQPKSREFYKKLLGQEPSLDVPGMTEFRLSEEHILGLMPVENIKKLLGEKIPKLSNDQGLRSELYFRVEDPETFVTRAIDAGATLLSSVTDRDWGMRAGYVFDLDGYILGISN